MIRYLTKKNLIDLNNKAIKNKKNRTLEPSILDKLSDTLKFPIVFSMVHNDCEIRAVVQISSNSCNHVCMDLDFKDYNKINKIGVNHATK